jgi:3-ketoacyl-CoA synthase
MKQIQSSTGNMIWLSPFPRIKSLYQFIINNVPIVIGVLLFAATILLKGAQFSTDGLFTWINALQLICFFLAAFLLRAAMTYYLQKQHCNVYLIDYSCFKPNNANSHRVPLSSFKEHFHLMPNITDHTTKFVARVLDHSGLGDETSLPPALFYIPPNGSFGDARDEAETVMFSVVDDLLAKTSINPVDIDILIVNCSVFSPVPSYSDMIINRYKLRSDIRSVQLSGMGCSAGLISVGLASNLLQTTPRGKHALVVSTETTTNIYYKGNKRAMQLTNMLFRMGGAAALLSSSGENARFRLNHLVRRTYGAQENAYKCVFLEEDDEENLGVNLSKDLIGVAGDALKTSMTAIGHLVLPTSEKLLFLLSVIAQKVLRGGRKLHIPNFCLAFEHFCIHAGGPAVIDAVQHNLNLSEEHVEPSKMTLHRFGNTSSSSLWYELAYIDAKGRMKKGDRVLMIGFGSGYKCNIAVWECIHAPYNADGPWTDCIYRYPIAPSILKP